MVRAKAASNLACVVAGNNTMAAMDLVRALGKASISCAIVTGTWKPACYSRHVKKVIIQQALAIDGKLRALSEFATAQAIKPVLFYEDDENLFFISKHRAHLSTLFHLSIADHNFILDLLDKARFLKLAKHFDLPVPTSHVLKQSTMTEGPELAIDFPAII